jgi:hypothetical protein
MATQCWSSVRARRMRVTRLDNCCTPLAPGAPCASLVTKGLVSVQYSPEIAEPEEIELRNGSGEICVTDPGCPEVKWWNLQMNFCGVDPDLFEFTTGSPMVLDWKGDAVGNRLQGNVTCDTSFAVETWTDLPQEQCADGLKEYGYFLVPCVTGGVLGEFTVQNDALTMQINARSRAGSGWGHGPYAVDQQDAAGTAGPLITPIGPKDHLDLHKTTIAPPEPVCGCQPMPQYDLSDLDPS